MAEPRDFWETWADEKSSRSDDRSSRSDERSSRPDDRSSRPGDRSSQVAAEEPAAPARSSSPDEDRPSEHSRGRQGDDRSARGGRGTRNGRSDRETERVERTKEPVAAPRATAAAAAPLDPSAQVRLHVNLGKKNGVAADDIRRLLGEDLGNDAGAIGSVAMRETYCHVRVPSELADRIIAFANGKEHGDVALKVELARS